MDKVRVGIVGSKFAADFHCDSYARYDKVEVVAVAAIDNLKEISEKWNEVARKKLKRYPNTDFYCGMIYELDMKENYYDKVVIHVVLHDVAQEKREAVVKAMVKRLKKKGKIILREPIKADHGMPENEIRELMKKAGMTEVQSQLTDRRLIGTVFDGVFEKK